MNDGKQKAVKDRMMTSRSQMILSKIHRSLAKGVCLIWFEPVEGHKMLMTYGTSERYDMLASHLRSDGKALRTLLRPRSRTSPLCRPRSLIQATIISHPARPVRVPHMPRARALESRIPPRNLSTESQSDGVSLESNARQSHDGK